MDSRKNTSVTFLAGLLLVLCQVGVARERDVTEVKGQKVELPCKVDYEGIRVQWLAPWGEVLTDNEHVVTSDMRVSIDSPYRREWVLSIADLRPRDEGAYICRALISPNYDDQVVNLIVDEPPSLVHASGDQEKRVGESVALECNATGKPQPVVTWYRFSSTGQRTAVGHTGWRYELRDIDESAAGEYQCEADNGHPPMARESMAVDVQFLPSVKLPYAQVSQELGKETLLNCFITANPLLEKYWMHNGVRVQDDGVKYRLITSKIDTYTITLGALILDMQADDLGEYTCVASNKNGTAEDTLTVFEPYTGRLRVLHPPRNAVTTPGRSVLFNCSVEGMTHKDTLIWWWLSPKHGARKIFSSDSGGSTIMMEKYRVTGHYNLWVDRVQHNDHGTYVCEISGLKNNSATLTVVDDIACRGNESAVEVGSTAMMMCSLNFSGAPLNWQVEWLHGDRRLTSISVDAPGRLARKVLLPQMSGADAGKYWCQVAAADPDFSTSCSLSLEVLESSVTAAPSCGGRFGMMDPLPIILGAVVAIAIIIIFCLCFCLWRNRKELKHYRPGQVRYSNGKGVSLGETEGLTAGDRKDSPPVPV